MIIRDITDRKTWERDLLVAKEKAEESDRLKSAFLANMSHEIRTPMNGILGFLDLLSSEDIDAKSRQKYMHVVNLSGQRLLDTINDIIEISKIEAGEQEVKNSAVDISEMMKYHLDFFQLQAKQKGIDLFVPERILFRKTFIETDKNKLDSILTNLIKNAIKFTVNGSIELGNYIENDSLVFYVKDTGCGIPKGKIEAVFERFIQADTSITRSHEGSGLGLTIAKAYVHLLGGKIWVESEVDKGSTFYFSIPYKSNLGKKRISDAQEVLSDEYSKETIILVAEDDATSFQYLEVVLKKKNITLFRAVNGKEAILIFKQNPDISLILMDIKMPGMDGFEATKEIRKLNKKVPIIAQTAYALSGDEEKARKAGCNDYIAKPIRSAELFILLDKYLIPSVSG
jgi:CheY-like chemotaxis protein/nitrogen-specific signal transduction histidine kinase